jgi:hypothetical protein
VGGFGKGAGDVVEIEGVLHIETATTNSGSTLGVFERFPRRAVEEAGVEDVVAPRDGGITAVRRGA